MTAPAVEIVAPADGAAITDAMIAATAEGLPDGSTVRVVERPTAKADVVVRVRWSDDAHRRAVLTVRTTDGRESERTFSFDAADPEAERGRTLGFALVAMVPEEMRSAPPEPPPAPPPPLATPQPSAAVESAAPPSARDESAARSVARSRVWLDALGHASAGIAGSAGGIGGALAVRVRLGSIALRVGGAARAGDVDEANASSATLRGDAGLAYSTVLVDPHLLVGARSSLVVLRHTLRRAEADGATSSGSHTLGGVELVAEVSYAFSPWFALTAGAGTEVAFGVTRVRVGTARVAEIPPVRLIGEAGARFAF